MRLAIDAMGGDNAPREVVNGAFSAAPDVDGDLILVGNPRRLEEFLPAHTPSNVHIHPAHEVISMDESPIVAIRRKKDSSLNVAVQLVADGECEAVISAGNTGAATALAKLRWKSIPGIRRPAIATQIPSKEGRFILLDSGATVDCDPQDLVGFALMGAAYATAVLGIQHPRIGLLNIGEEAGKGNQLVKRTYALMKQDIDNFVGNVEGKHMFEGHVDVVVCDAFVGNIVLKTGEGIAEMIMDAIKESLPKSPLLRLPLPLLLGGLQSLKKNLDYAEYGGAPLLGVNGVFIICHGRSDEKAIRIAILHAQRAVKNGLIDRIRTSALAFRREKQHA